jgi:hypothetical protein
MNLPVKMPIPLRTIQLFYPKYLANGILAGLGPQSSGKKVAQGSCYLLPPGYLD